MDVKRRPVFVEWVDSAGRSGWQTPEEADAELMHCQTIGWIVKEDKTKIVIALNGVFDGSSRVPFGETITIPKCSIVKRKKVVA